MIRFCDKEVYNVNLADCSLEGCYNFFVNNHKKDILCVYDEIGNIYGTMSFGDLCEKQDVEKAICKKKILFSEDMWDDIHNYINEYKMIFVPLYNKSGEIEVFSYDDVRKSWEYNCINNTIVQMQKESKTIMKVFNGIFPNIKVLFLYEMNEWSYLIYKVFSMNNFPTILIGRNWSIVKKNKKQWNENDYADFSILKIYSEGCQEIKEEAEYPSFPFKSVEDSFLLFKQLGEFATIFIKEAMISKLLDKKANVFSCRIPKRDELNIFIDSEKAEYAANIAIAKDKFISFGKYLNDYQKKLLFLAYGKENCEYFRRIKSTSDFNNLTDFINNGAIGKVVRQKDNNKLKKRIYLIGLCIVSGYYVRYYNSLQYYLQQKSEDYVVVSFVYQLTDYIRCKEILEKLPLRKEDIVLFVDDFDKFSCDERCSYIDVLDVYNNPLRNRVIFADKPIHTNAEGNRLLAEKISVNIFSANLNQDIIDNTYIQRGEIIDDNMKNEIHKYIDGINNNTIGLRNGAIVMNANRFTNGHLYLIETSAAKVETLFVFVVEEDKSKFKFEDRFRLVKEQVSHIKNVVVVPSGKFVLSYMTFPVYFEKAEKQEQDIDASSDIEIFARYIAPDLNIKYRFVGEEPLDRVTNQYNEQMELLLKEWGINFIVIPRRKAGEKVISASLVRKFAENGEWEKVKELVPNKTYEFLWSSYKV